MEKVYLKSTRRGKWWASIDAPTKSGEGCKNVIKIFYCESKAEAIGETIEWLSEIEGNQAGVNAGATASNNVD